MKKKVGIILMLICMLFSGCSKNASDAAMTGNSYDKVLGGGTNGFSYGGVSSEASDEISEIPGESVSEGNLSGEKLIRTVSLRLQTKEFDTLLAYLEENLLRLGGYVENSRIEGNSLEYTGYRSAVMTVRIPKNLADEFIQGVGEKAVVVSKSENVENVTLQYADSESRLKALRIEQERFLELLGKAEDIETILTLERHLTELRYQIETYESQLRCLENRVEYTSITISISEVKRITQTEEKPTIFTRMKQGFVQAFYDISEEAGDFLVWFVSNILYLIIWGVILFFGIKIICRILKKRKKKGFRTKKEEALPAKEGGPENGEQDGRVDSEK